MQTQSKPSGRSKLCFLNGSHLGFEVTTEASQVFDKWSVGSLGLFSQVWKSQGVWTQHMPRTPGNSCLMDYPFNGFPWAWCPLRGGQSQQTPLQPLAHSGPPGRSHPDLVAVSHESVVVGNRYMASAVVTTVNKVWSLPVGHAMFHCRQHVRKPQR